MIPAALPANTDQYMMLVDRSPVKASYARMVDGTRSPLPPGIEGDVHRLRGIHLELMIDSMQRVAGAVDHAAERVNGVKETTFSLFDSRTTTPVSVRHELKVK